MCGISLIYNQNGSTPSKALILTMVASLNHRGPDDQNVVVKPGVALGHNRLSIVDLEHGIQPMSSESNRFCIIFNGEIYNYKELKKDLISKGIKFNTQSDTEVLLQLYVAYGRECLQHLRGMFSFAIHDSLKNEMFIARDRLGIKPLFYYEKNGIFIAASEIKAILASGIVTPSFNNESIKNYFTYQFSLTPNTLFTDINELPAGHYMCLRRGEKTEIRQYWDLEFPEKKSYESLSEQYWLDELNIGLESAVSSHTTGDVPIGSYLSGGIDSAAITAILKQKYSKNIKSFSISFENKEHDESVNYKRIAEYLQIDNAELVFRDNSDTDYLGLLRKCLYHLEQPQRMTVDIPHFMLSHFARKRNHKVVFSGDGADEIFAGYNCFREDSMRTNYNSWRKWYRRKNDYLKEYTNYYSTDFMQMLLALHKNSEQQKVKKRFGFYPPWYGFWAITKQLSTKLFSQDFLDSVQDEQQMNNLVETMGDKIKNRDLLNQSLYFETKTRLPGWILCKSDRLSMAHGVEARVPFMDHALVELAARIPPQYKLNGMNEKYLLKKLMSNRLPAIETKYKKRGFYTPIREWLFCASQIERVKYYLSTKKLQEVGIFNSVEVNKLLNILLRKSAAKNLNEYYQTMQLEWILMLVLSTQLLHELFIMRQGSCFSNNKLSEVSLLND